MREQRLARDSAFFDAMKQKIDRIYKGAKAGAPFVRSFVGRNAHLREYYVPVQRCGA